MVRGRRTYDEEPPTPPRPATTPEAREKQLVDAAVSLAERQLLDGTASAQVITHYLKASSGREQLELEKLRRENILLSAKAEQMESAKRMEALYEKAILSMRSYAGQDVGEDEGVDADSDL
jgi:hypothetical protein